MRPFEQSGVYRRLLLGIFVVAQIWQPELTDCRLVIVPNEKARDAPGAIIKISICLPDALENWECIGTLITNSTYITAVATLQREGERHLLRLFSQQRPLRANLF